MINEVLWKTYTDVGCTAYSEGNYALAQKMFAEALNEVCQSDDNDARLGSSLRNLALVYHMQGDYKRAEPLFKKSLAICEKLLGRCHTHVFNNLDNLAELYFLEGKYQKAKLYYKRAVSVFESLSGDTDPALVPRLNRLAWIHTTLGRNDEALMYFKRAQTIKQLHAPLHEVTVYTEPGEHNVPVIAVVTPATV
jgi:tetratricopeptide (TPR) repeat protein